MSQTCLFFLIFLCSFCKFFSAEILADLLGGMPVIETPSESTTIVNLSTSGKSF